jgi:hypothetical protein
VNKIPESYNQLTLKLKHQQGQEYMKINSADVDLDKIKSICSKGYIIFDMIRDGFPTFTSDISAFNANNKTLTIIDPLCGKLPYIFSNKYFNNESLDVKYIPTIILDSNIASDLHQFVTNIDSNHKDKDILELIILFIKHNVDYNLFYYCIEAICKSKVENHKAIIETIISILQLHTMDENHFLAHHQIKPDPIRVKSYLFQHNCNNLNEVAIKWFEKGNDKDLLLGIDQQNKFTYAILLKIAITYLIKGKQSQSLENFKTIYQFMIDEYNCTFSRELIIAALVFIGELQKFLPAKPGIQYSELKKILIATAWDIQLLRINEILLTMSYPHESPIGYIVTRDKQLASLKGVFEIQSILVKESGLANPRSTISTNLQHIKNDKKRSYIKQMMDFLLEKQNLRQKADESHIRNSDININSLTYNLEIELQDILKN